MSHPASVMALGCASTLSMFSYVPHLIGVSLGRALCSRKPPGSGGHYVDSQLNLEEVAHHPHRRPRDHMLCSMELFAGCCDH